MIEQRSAKDVLEKCDAKGQILPLAEIDIELIKTIIELSKADQEAIEKLKKDLKKESLIWNNIYIFYYDALHKLVDAYLRFDKIISLNHLCLFTYLCEKHQELELDWDFFDKIRTKRNGINYYGQKITYDDLKSIEVQIKLYISLLEKELKTKTDQFID